MKKFFEEFKKFALRGNVLDMAVGVIIGGAFTGIVTALTQNFINPLLNVVMTGSAGNLGDTEMAWTFGGAASAFLTTVVNFFITAFVLFLLIKGMNKLATINKKPEAPKAPTTKKCPYCLSDIDIKATRCPHCTSEIKE
ncbi:MAG: large conductance mechanosensitive channel protein MscL [Clostridia bacterium]|nr:large conductance mechanosensitive channel protein MscL [Clostridia bacterium]